MTSDSDYVDDVRAIGYNTDSIGELEASYTENVKLGCQNKIATVNIACNIITRKEQLISRHSE